MDSKIIKFMKKYDISDIEINDLPNIAPMLEVTNYKDFVANCKILIDNGYPKEDLDYLILANPNIFCMSAMDLSNALSKLNLAENDLETLLKENPYLL